MGIFDGILLCTDMDGTLTDSTSTLSEKNAAAIRFFQREGGLFTVATGRHPFYIRDFAPRFVPNTYIVCQNGGLVYDLATSTEVLWHLLDDECTEVIDYLRQNHPDTDIRLHTTPDEKHYVKAVFCQPEQFVPERQKELREKFGNRYSFVRSFDRGLEMLAKEGGKGNALRDVIRLEKRNIHTVVAVGDYENDIDLFKAADISYAPSNALDITKAAATKVTVSNDEDAISRIIDELSCFNHKYS